MNVTLYDYQKNAINEIVSKGVGGTRKLIFQLATGGGKTVAFCALIDLFLRAFPGKKAMVLVHRKQLLIQAQKTLLNNHGIFAETIVANKKYPDLTRQVFVAMVDTAANRLRKFPAIKSDVGLVIIDECHIGNFTKLHELLPDPFIFGFSATPISANKKLPLKSLYDDIVTAIDIPDLVKEGALSPNRTLSIKGVNRAILKMSGGDFNERQMGDEYSAPKHVENCVKKYREHADGKKAIIFNCNIDHSNLVNSAFLSAGYNSRHIDSTMHEKDISEAYAWFKATPGAILNNVGKATTGYDEPSIEAVIVNRSTTSLPLWLQMCGRGSRIHPGKENFLILDLGGNARAMGDWCQPRNWRSIFFNPPKSKSGDGVAPMKTCPKCESFIAAQLRTCNFCGFEFISEGDEYDKQDIDLEWISSTISVEKAISRAEKRGYKPYASLHLIKDRIVDQAFVKDKNMGEGRYYRLLAGYHSKVQEWCKINDKPYNRWHRDTSAKWLMEAVKERFGFEIRPLEIKL